MVAGVGGELLEREGVLGEARAAEADPRPEEALADPAVVADRLGHLDHVGARRLADVRDLVDERDPGHQRGVRGELRHLRRGDVRADDRGVDSCVELLDGVRVGSVERADDDPVGLHEVLDRRPLGRELGVRGVPDVPEPARVEAMPDLLTGPDGHGALHDDDDAVVDLGQLVDDHPHRGEVGVAGDRRRRADRDVDELRALDRLRDVGRERQPLAVPLEELVEARLVDRHLAAAERVDLPGKDVPDR